MMKGLFRLLWNVILEDLAKMLGFNSPKALASCMSASDHHKSWQIIKIVLHSVAEELIWEFVRDKLPSNEVLNTASYYLWLSNVKNENYRFMADVVFTYCFALHLFRSGVRWNNAEAINTAKTKFSSLFFLN